MQSFVSTSFCYPYIHLVIHLMFCVSLPQTLDPLSVAATTSDELLSSGHFQMPFDIVRDGEKQGMQASLILGLVLRMVS